jgi:hypothetical protein
VKALSTVALVFATALSASFAAHAQTEQATVHRHNHFRHYHPPHHTVHHSYVAHGSASALIARRPGEPIESGPTETNQIFRPYAQPEEGDSNGLSSDPNDCNKGCIGGNPC